MQKKKTVLQNLFLKNMVKLEYKIFDCSSSVEAVVYFLYKEFFYMNYLGRTEAIFRNKGKLL